MDYILLTIGFLCILMGLLGSVLPVLPGPPLSWLGILLLYCTDAMEFNHAIVWGTLFAALLISILDYIIPSRGTKYFGGSNYGIWGTNIGLVIGIVFPIIPLSFIIMPFVGALIGELIYDSKDVNRALKAALGSFIGFLTSTFIKIIFCTFLMILFVYKIIEFRHLFFS